MSSGAAIPSLPAPGAMVGPSASFAPPVLKGLRVHPEDPLRFDFIVDTGDAKMEGEALKKESEKLIKYFLASLTTPEDDLWVNLSPYEKDRVIPEKFGQTEMGRDLLAQDYLLKQLTASLIYPEDDLGKEFWGRVYKKAYELYGTTDIPVNTFNKVWIVPEKAVVYEIKDSAFVVESRLKVMLEGDYLALKNNFNRQEIGTDKLAEGDIKQLSDISSGIVREVIIPAIENEVNDGENFSQLRQIYHSLILSVWYKKRIQDSILGRVYVDKNKVAGVDVENKNVRQQIYDQYIEAFKRGVYDYVKESEDPNSNVLVMKRYFSGGVSWHNIGDLADIEVADTSEKFGQIVEINRRSEAHLQVVLSPQEGISVRWGNEDLGKIDGPTDGEAKARSFGPAELRTIAAARKFLEDDAHQMRMSIEERRKQWSLRNEPADQEIFNDGVVLFEKFLKNFQDIVHWIVSGNKEGSGAAHYEDLFPLFERLNIFERSLYHHDLKFGRQEDLDEEMLLRRLLTRAHADGLIDQKEDGRIQPGFAMDLKAELTAFREDLIGVPGNELDRNRMVEQIRIFLEGYALDILSLLSLRTFESYEDNFAKLQSLLDDLREAPGGSGLRYIDNVCILPMIAAQAPVYQGKPFLAYRNLIRMGNILSSKDRIHFMSYVVKETARHRLLIAPSLAAAAPDEKIVSRKNDDLDFYLMTYGLVALLVEYSNLIRNKGENNEEGRKLIAEAVLSAIHADFECFLDPEGKNILRGLFYSGNVPAWESELLVDSYFALLKMHKDSLWEDSRSFSDGNSIIGVVGSRHPERGLFVPGSHIRELIHMFVGGSRADRNHPSQEVLRGWKNLTEEGLLSSPWGASPSLQHKFHFLTFYPDVNSWNPGWGEFVVKKDIRPFSETIQRFKNFVDAASLAEIQDHIKAMVQDDGASIDQEANFSGLTTPNDDFLNPTITRRTFFEYARLLGGAAVLGGFVTFSGARAEETASPGMADPFENKGPHDIFVALKGDPDKILDLMKNGQTFETRYCAMLALGHLDNPDWRVIWILDDIREGRFMFINQGRHLRDALVFSERKDDVKFEAWRMLEGFINKYIADQMVSVVRDSSLSVSTRSAVLDRMFTAGFAGSFEDIAGDNHLPFALRDKAADYAARNIIFDIWVPKWRREQQKAWFVSLRSMSRSHLLGEDPGQNINSDWLSNLMAPRIRQAWSQEVNNQREKYLSFYVRWGETPGETFTPREAETVVKAVIVMGNIFAPDWNSPGARRNYVNLVKDIFKFPSRNVSVHGLFDMFTRDIQIFVPEGASPKSLAFVVAHELVHYFGKAGLRRTEDITLANAFAVWFLITTYGLEETKSILTEWEGFSRHFIVQLRKNYKESLMFRIMFTLEAIVRGYGPDLFEKGSSLVDKFIQRIEHTITDYRDFEEGLRFFNEFVGQPSAREEMILKSVKFDTSKVSDITEINLDGDGNNRVVYPLAVRLAGVAYGLSQKTGRSADMLRYLLLRGYGMTAPAAEDIVFGNKNGLRSFVVGTRETLGEFISRAGAELKLKRGVIIPVLFGLNLSRNSIWTSTSRAADVFRSRSILLPVPDHPFWRAAVKPAEKLQHSDNNSSAIGTATLPLNPDGGGVKGVKLDFAQLSPDDVESRVISDLKVQKENLDRQELTIKGKKIAITRYKQAQGEPVPFLRVGKFLITHDKFMDAISDEVKKYPFLIVLSAGLVTDDDVEATYELGLEFDTYRAGGMVSILALMQAYEEVIRGCSFVDAGAGISGILSIAANMLGAKEIIAIDKETDPENLKMNLDANHVGSYKLFSEYVQEVRYVASHHLVVAVNEGYFGTMPTIKNYDEVIGVEDKFPTGLLESTFMMGENPDVVFVAGGKHFDKSLRHVDTIFQKYHSRIVDSVIIKDGSKAMVGKSEQFQVNFDAGKVEQGLPKKKSNLDFPQDLKAREIHGTSGENTRPVILAAAGDRVSVLLENHLKLIFTVTEIEKDNFYVKVLRVVGERGEFFLKYRRNNKISGADELKATREIKGENIWDAEIVRDSYGFECVLSKRVTPLKKYGDIDLTLEYDATLDVETFLERIRGSVHFLTGWMDIVYQAFSSLQQVSQAGYHLHESFSQNLWVTERNGKLAVIQGDFEAAILKQKSSDRLYDDRVNEISSFMLEYAEGKNFPDQVIDQLRYFSSRRGIRPAEIDKFLRDLLAQMDIRGGIDLGRTESTVEFKGPDTPISVPVPASDPAAIKALEMQPLSGFTFTIIHMGPVPELSVLVGDSFPWVDSAGVNPQRAKLVEEAKMTRY